MAVKRYYIVTGRRTNKAIFLNTISTLYVVLFRKKWIIFLPVSQFQLCCYKTNSDCGILEVAVMSGKLLEVTSHANIPDHFTLRQTLLQLH